MEIENRDVQKLSGLVLPEQDVPVTGWGRGCLVPQSILVAFLTYAFHFPSAVASIWFFFLSVLCPSGRPSCLGSRSVAKISKKAPRPVCGDDIYLRKHPGVLSSA
jgi:hypothetical protein